VGWSVAEESGLQRQLYTNAISSATDRPIPEAVLTLYQEHEPIRRLNESYGYR
jgi:hypothetical protein